MAAATHLANVNVIIRLVEHSKLLPHWRELLAMTTPLSRKYTSQARQSHPTHLPWGVHHNEMKTIFCDERLKRIIIQFHRTELIFLRKITGRGEIRQDSLLCTSLVCVCCSTNSASELRSRGPLYWVTLSPTNSFNLQKNILKYCSYAKQ